MIGQRLISREVDGPYYDITNLDLKDLLRIVNFKLQEPEMGLAAYGLGGLFTPRMSDEEASKYLNKQYENIRDYFGKKKVVDVPILKGLECNLQVYECKGKILLPPYWYDNSNGTVRRFFHEALDLSHNLLEEIERSSIGLKEYKVGIEKEIKEFYVNFIFSIGKKVEKIAVKSWDELGIKH